MSGQTAVGGRRITADIGIQLVGRVLNLLLGLVVTLVVVRTLGEHRYGQWSTILAVGELLGYFGELGLDRVTVRQAAGDPEHESEWLGALLSLRILLAVPVTLAFLAIMFAISADGTMRISSAVFAVLSLAAPFGALTLIFQLKVRNDLTMAMLTLNSVLWTGSALALSMFTHSMIGFSIAFIGAFLITVAVQTVFRRRLATIRIRGSRQHWRELAALAIPVGIASMLTFAYGRIDQILVFQIKGSDAAGIYGAMYRILTTTAFVPIAVITTLFPILSKVERPQMRRMAVMATEYLAMASFPIFTFVLAASSPVVRLLFGHQFVQGHNALRVLMGAFLAICFGYVAGVMIIVLRLQKQFVRYALLALVVNVVLNLIFIPQYGYMAAAWITLITEVLVQILSMRLVMRELEFRPKLGRFVRIGIAAGGMGFAVWGLHAAGVALPWLIAVAAASYPVLLLALRALVPSELRALMKREAV